MISIIICTNTKLNNVFIKNIDETIGTRDYQIITIDTSQKKHSIHEAYNIGIEKAQYPFLCFLHNDIIFRTSNWGNLIIEAFKDKKIGVLGVIGAKTTMEYSWGWWENPFHEGCIIQNYSHNALNIPNKYIEETTPILKDVVVVDGMFLALPKTIFRHISFDTKTYKGFHLYDSDICMQAIEKGYNVKVVKNILIEHYSYGNPDKYFSENMYKFYQKWKHKLPIYSKDIQETEILQQRDIAIKHLFDSKSGAYNKFKNIEINKTIQKNHLTIQLSIYLPKIIRKILLRPFSLS